MPMHTTAVDRVYQGGVGFDALSELFEARVRRDAADFLGNVREGLNEFLGGRDRQSHGACPRRRSLCEGLSRQGVTLRARIGSNQLALLMRMRVDHKGAS